ncbi:MAG: hypothetical protein ACKVKR_07400, partial [Pseudomonadales bacterium]
GSRHFGKTPYIVLMRLIVSTIHRSFKNFLGSFSAMKTNKFIRLRADIRPVSYTPCLIFFM